MELECLVLSRDWQELGLLECILASLHLGAHIETDAQRARTKIRQSKMDAVVVDCDLRGSEDFLEHLRKTKGVDSLPLVLLSASPDQHNLFASGATFYFAKPLSVEQTVRTFSAARNLMLESRLRYHRQPVNATVSIRLPRRKPLNAELRNLSCGGIGVHASQVLEACGPLELRFDLPDGECVIQARGELAWRDATGHAGIRFLEVPEMLERRIERWLEKNYFSH